MSDTLPADEIERMTGYKRPADQLRELRRQGFYRARLNAGPGKRYVVLERPHYEAVVSGRMAAVPLDPQVIKPSTRGPVGPFPWDKRTALYRHFTKDDALLYVGIAVDPDKRAGEHRREQKWSRLSARVSVEWFNTRREAMAAERAAIQAESPKFNTLHQRSPTC